jgi:hypothetical protein
VFNHDICVLCIVCLGILRQISVQGINVHCVNFVQCLRISVCFALVLNASLVFATYSTFVLT